MQRGPVSGPVSGARRRRGRQLRGLVAAALLLPGATGCYTYAPLWNGDVEPDRRVRIGLSDQGRVTLAPTLGTGVTRLEGRVITRTDSAVTLAISGVEYANAHGVFARWSGERVDLPRSVFAGVAERKLSRTRTWTAVGLAVLAAGALSTLAIKGFGTDPPSNRDPGVPNSQ